MICVENVYKIFVLYQQYGVCLLVLVDVLLIVNVGECVVFYGYFGSGKLILLCLLYVNYLLDSGYIYICYGDEWVDLVIVILCKVLEVCKIIIGWVSQFLWVILCILVLEVVMQLLFDFGMLCEVSVVKVVQFLICFNVLECLWYFVLFIFFGGEQQWVNIVCGFVVDYLILFFDEFIVLLDGKNSVVVVNLIYDVKVCGVVIVGIFYDEGVCCQVVD